MEPIRQLHENKAKVFLIQNWGNIPALGKIKSLIQNVSILIAVTLFLGFAFTIAVRAAPVMSEFITESPLKENGPDGDPIADTPAFVSTSITTPVNENEVATLNGEFVDTDVGDTFTLVVDWGDGTQDTYNYTVGEFTFSETHQYLDDNPTVTTSDLFTVSLDLSDSFDLHVTDELTVTVDNVAPVLSNLSTTPIDENGTATLSGDIIDPGTLDTFSLEVDWGDGSVDTYSYAAGATSFSETHQYLDDDPTATAFDIYTVALTLTDDDTGTDTDRHGHGYG